MPVMDEPLVARVEAGAAPNGSDFLVQVSQALVDINAPIRSKGPSLLKVGTLFIKQLFAPIEHEQLK